MEKKYPLIDPSDDNDMSYSEMLAHIMFDDLIPPEKREEFLSEKPKKNDKSESDSK